MLSAELPEYKKGPAASTTLRATHASSLVVTSGAKGVSAAGGRGCPSALKARTSKPPPSKPDAAPANAAASLAALCVKLVGAAVTCSAPQKELARSPKPA